MSAGSELENTKQSVRNGFNNNNAVTNAPFLSFTIGEAGASCYRGILCKTIILMAKSPTAVVS